MRWHLGVSENCLPLVFPWKKLGTMLGVGGKMEIDLPGLPAKRTLE